MDKAKKKIEKKKKPKFNIIKPAMTTKAPKKPKFNVKKEPAKKPDLAKPKKKGIILRLAASALDFYDPKRKERTARANKNPAFLESNDGKLMVDVLLMEDGGSPSKKGKGKKYYQDDKGNLYEYMGGSQKALTNPKKIKKL